MAKQCGHFNITGTIDGICFYRMKGAYYARMKSSLTRKRVMKDPAFRRTREHAAVLGEASKIASGVYRQMRKEDKKHALYREMTGKAILLLREGQTREEIFRRLSGLYLKVEATEKPLSELMVIPEDGRVKGEKRPGKSRTRAFFSLIQRPGKFAQQPPYNSSMRRERRTSRRRPLYLTGGIQEACRAMGP